MLKGPTSALIGLFIAFVNQVQAQSISHTICSNYESIMGSTVLSWRQSGQIPIRVAEDVWNSEDDVRTRVFLKRVTREIYKDPMRGEDFLRSKRFFNECVATHRGY